VVVAGDRQNLALTRAPQLRHHLFSAVVVEIVAEAVDGEAASLLLRLQHLFVLLPLLHPATFLQPQVRPPH
jgi:hypothetical protein